MYVGHHINKCQYGYVHGQCRCPTMSKTEIIIDCPTPDEHRPKGEALQGSTWLYRSTGERNREALLSVPAGYRAPETLVISQEVLGGAVGIAFHRVKEVEE